MILLLLKSRKDLSGIRTPDQLRTVELFEQDYPILLRISSECLFGVFGDSHCDCESQRLASLWEIQRLGQGIYVHLPQEGQGNGLLYKAKELQIQVRGIDPAGKVIGPKSVIEAAKYLLGKDEELDKRQYTSLQGIFRDLCLNRYGYSVIGENPTKARFLQQALDIRILDLHPAKRSITIENVGEFLAKLYQKGFAVPNRDLEQIYTALLGASEIPVRVLDLLGHIKEDMELDKVTFAVDQGLLRKIISIADERGLSYQHVADLELLKDAEAYDEYQVELAVSRDQLDVLFEKQVLLGVESLRYEENHFYNLAPFPDAPARSLKIRYAYNLTNFTRPFETKFIYKIPTGESTYRIRSRAIAYDDVARLLADSLRTYEQFILRVLTHNVTSIAGSVTVLVKRYADDLRTLSLMGKVDDVKDFIRKIEEHVRVQVIPDPSNYLYIDRSLMLRFDRKVLAKEEREFFLAHYVQ
jgi:GTP cyclohydrolase II